MNVMNDDQLLLAEMYTALRVLLDEMEGAGVAVYSQGIHERYKAAEGVAARYEEQQVKRQAAIAAAGLTTEAAR